MPEVTANKFTTGLRIAMHRASDTDLLDVMLVIDKSSPEFKQQKDTILEYLAHTSVGFSPKFEHPSTSLYRLHATKEQLQDIAAKSWSLVFQENGRIYPIAVVATNDSDSALSR